MSSIEEKRKEKMKELGQDTELSTNESLESPEVEQQPSPFKELPPSIEFYLETFGLSSDSKSKLKQGVFLDAELLKMVKNTIFYLDMDLPMSAFIENVLRDHFRSYLDLINTEIAKREPNILPKK